jgi:ribose 1,5-bisphosphokinase PhnN
MSASPFVISQHPFVMAEILRRIRARENMERVARRLGMSSKRYRIGTTHVAKISRSETVESNLPLPERNL